MVYKYFWYYFLTCFQKADDADNKEEIPLTESYEDSEHKNSECPEMYSSFYSQLSFHWFTG